MNEDYIKKSIEKGLCLLINECGGYHCDSIDGLIDVHESKGYPKLIDRATKFFK